MKEQEIPVTHQPSEGAPMVVATDNGEFLWVTEDGTESADAAMMAADGESAQIVVVETDDGEQQIQLVTEDGGQLLTLPPELASRLKENLSDLVAGQDVQQVIVSGDEEAQAEPADGAADVLTLQMTPAGEEDAVEAGAAAGPDTSDGGSSGHEAVDTAPALDGIVKVEEEVSGSADDGADVIVGEEGAEEEIGKLFGGLNQGASAGGVEVGQACTVGAGLPAESAQVTVSEWMESTVRSASGAELKIRLPSLAALSGVTAVQATPPDLRALQTDLAVQPHLKKERSRAEEDAWAARTRRRASRGIARAVAAVRRAEDSDSFDSGEDDDGDEEEAAAPRPTAAGGDPPRRGRGRPRKTGGFSCQLCARRLSTQAEFFQHLRDHYEKPAGEVAVEDDLPAIPTDGERLRPVGEEEAPTDGDGAAVLNVDIIAAESADFMCERCERHFYTEDDLERHRKEHIAEALAAEAESSEPESDHETVHGRGGGQEGGSPHAARPSGALEVPVTGGGAADQYEMKNLKKCGECPKLFTTVSSLGSHKQRAHAVDGAPLSATNAAKLEYECDLCHVTYTSQKIYERHRRLHEDRAAGRLPHHCSTCGASFLTSMLLAHHAQKEHPEMCRRRQRRPGDGPARPNGRPPGSSDKRRQAVYDQIKELDSGMFSCTICGKEAKSKNQMFYHVSMKHKALEGHKCNSCDKSFFTETALRVHERTHTGERPFVCDFCSRRFRQQADLNSHVMSLHTMERPFRCRFCSKAFARKYSRTIHMRCHTNERNYKCPICNKGFRASTYLTGHMKIHTGERTHSCPICQKAFRMRSDMKRHIFTHSRDRQQPRSLRALTVPLTTGEPDNGVMLLEPAQLCLQLVTNDDGESMVITEGDQTLVLDGSQTLIDEQTGQLTVPESAMTELDESAVASMYLMAEGGDGALELT